MNRPKCGRRDREDFGARAADITSSAEVVDAYGAPLLSPMQIIRSRILLSPDFGDGFRRR